MRRRTPRGCHGADRARRSRGRAGREEELPRRDAADHRRLGPRQGKRLRVAGLRLRLRVRAGPAVRAGRHRGHRQRAALALLRAGRERRPRRQTTTSSPTSSTSGSRTCAPCRSSCAARRRTARPRRRATRSRASSPATTRYLKRTGRASCPIPPAAARRWVRPITTLDIYRRIYQLGLRASSGNFRNEIVAAEPPSGNASAARRIDPQAFNRRLGADQLGSNGLGVGRDGADGERALLLSNTHFPWHGSERWYEVHLTIPGKLDVIGASLQGVPVVNLGFTRGVAWSHTVSTARRFTAVRAGPRPRAPDRVRRRRPGNVKMRKRTVRVRVRRRRAAGTRSTRRAGGRSSPSRRRA